MLRALDLSDLIETRREDVLSVSVDVDPTKPEHQHDPPAHLIWLRHALDDLVESPPRCAPGRGGGGPAHRVLRRGPPPRTGDRGLRRPRPLAPLRPPGAAPQPRPLRPARRAGCPVGDRRVRALRDPGGGPGARSDHPGLSGALGGRRERGAVAQRPAVAVCRRTAAHLHPARRDRRQPRRAAGDVRGQRARPRTPLAAAPRRRRARCAISCRRPRRSTWSRWCRCPPGRSPRRSGRGPSRPRWPRSGAGRRRSWPASSTAPRAEAGWPASGPPSRR